ncbi:MAG: ABC transporter permease [Candidatus Cloacimonetes bacterium]|nr:ABC transporter permease [Candidatus Cloacimonadota bacterium]
MAISITESIRVGLSDFWSRKIRSFVTILGIMLGTMSVIVILAMVNGINKQTLAWMMERGGLAKITIHHNWGYESKKNLPDYFTLKEIFNIRELLPEAQYYNPEMNDWGRLSYLDKSFRTRVQGIVPDFQFIEEWSVDQGRFISQFDIDQNNDVIVIGTKAVEELFGSAEPLGKFINFNSRRLQIIGIMKHRYLKNSFNVGDENSLDYLNWRCFVPISTMINKISGEDKINTLTLKAHSPEEAPDLADKLEEILLNMRQGEPIFDIQSAKEEAQQIEKNAGTFRVVFFLISIISLLVAGIVIINIMLATIQERTREIGIRLAVGARRFDIFIQFLVQTVIVTFIGGLIGTAAGISMLNIVSKYMEFQLIAYPGMVIVALAVAVGVGFLAGIIPAVKAANLDPVQALHYE